MTTSSEDVLLMVGEVRNKKTDGTFYLMSERIAWMPNGKDTFTISHKYADIKMQKISPEGKPKIQLQVVLHNNEATTFHFVHADGVDRQLKDRNEIKEMLQQLLPKFKQKISKELEEKNRVLAEDANLFQLYKDLVVSQVISPEEFWKQIAPIRCPSLLDVISVQSVVNDDRPNFLLRTAKQNLQQSIGISPAFLADIKPQPDGCNGIRYNITTDIIEAIFRTYPAVQQKHFDHVPQKMNESEFWTRFFQSHYFHRDRVLTGATSTKTDLFADCAQEDEQQLKQIASEKRLLDAFSDLETFDDSEYISRLQDEERKEEKKEENAPKKRRERDKDVQLGSALSANQALIKRFNHHSIMVLEATNHHVAKASRAKSAAVAADGGDGGESAAEQQAKRQKIVDSIEMEDLNERCLIDSDSWMSEGAKQLNIVNKERYLAGPSVSSHDFADRSSSNSIKQLNNYQELLLSHWNDSTRDCLNTPSAIKALSELSPGGALVKSAQSIVLKDIVPADTQKELRQLYFSGNELLKHFWSCFPITNERFEEKLTQMKQTLERFQFTKLIPFQDKLNRDQYNSEVSSPRLVSLVISTENV
jgi:transcription initiation factor TFIIH subunit 1